MELEGQRGEEEKRKGEVMVRIYCMKKLLSIKKERNRELFPTIQVKIDQSSETSVAKSDVELRLGIRKSDEDSSSALSVLGVLFLL